MKKTRRRKCRQCGQLYKPDPRNRTRQYTCSAPTCQTARHKANQEAWRNRPENKGYFSGPDQVRRVQAWRKAHPGYGRGSKKPLQDSLQMQTPAKEEDTSSLNLDALQDAILAQPPLIVGLIATLIGSSLQDDIAQSILKFHHRGQQILQTKGKGNDDQQTCVMSGAAAQNSGAVQLGGP